MKWLKSWFGNPSPQLSAINASLEALQEAVANNESSLQKGLRRLSMAQRQQGDSLAALVEESSGLKFALQQREGLAISYPQLLEIVDNLSKIQRAAGAQDAEVVAPLVSQSIEELLALGGLKPVVSLGQAYPEEGCEVLGAVPHGDYSPGAVVDILQQGYCNAEGHFVRRAKVMVASQVQPPQTIPDKAS